MARRKLSRSGPDRAGQTSLQRAGRRPGLKTCVRPCRTRGALRRSRSCTHLTDGVAGIRRPPAGHPFDGAAAAAARVGWKTASAWAQAGHSVATWRRGLSLAPVQARLEPSARAPVSPSPGPRGSGCGWVLSCPQGPCPRRRLASESARAEARAEAGQAERRSTGRLAREPLRHKQTASAANKLLQTNCTSLNSLNSKQALL